MSTFLITGATQGIGFEVARQLLALGHEVIVTGRQGSKVTAAVAALASENASGQVMDVSDDASVREALAALGAERRAPLGLINNAARIYGRYASTVEDTSAGALLEAIDNNALGAYRTIQAALPAMRASGWGRIVNVSSGMGSLTEGGGGAVAYRISKVAMNGVTMLAHHANVPGVKVNAVCPGWVRTELGGSAAPRDVAEGAAGIVWAATLPDDGPSGGFFRDGKPIPW